MTDLEIVEMLERGERMVIPQYALVVRKMPTHGKYYIVDSSRGWDAAGAFYVERKEWCVYGPDTKASTLAGLLDRTGRQYIYITDGVEVTSDWYVFLSGGVAAVAARKMGVQS